MEVFSLDKVLTFSAYNSPMARILLVEDDPRIARPLARELLLERHTLDLAVDGEEGWAYLSETPYDLAIIDVMLPRIDGIELCRRLRRLRADPPVLLLTALDSTADKVRGLDAGADDYLVKPFSLEELHARVRALLRRSPGSSPGLSWGCIELDPASKRVSVGGAEVDLTPREYQILELFLRNRERLMDADEILQKVWGWEAPGRGSVKTHLQSMREKLRKAGAPNPIETLYGRGYRLSHEY